MQMQAYFLELVGESERDFLMKESDLSFGVLENLVDFEITRRIDNKKWELKNFNYFCLINI